MDNTSTTRTQPTKRAQLERLLSRKSGTTMAALVATLGWQPHSIRAALSRLRKAGHVIETTGRESGGAVLRIVRNQMGS